MTAKPGKPAPPTDAALTRELGPSRPLWDELRAALAREIAPLTEEWAWSGAKLGWALRLGHRKRPVIYLKPLDGHFRASLALGPKGEALAREQRLPAGVIRLIEEAPVYPEGKAVRLEIRTAGDVAIAVRLAAIRVAT